MSEDDDDYYGTIYADEEEDEDEDMDRVGDGDAKRQEDDDGIIDGGSASTASKSRGLATKDPSGHHAGGGQWHRGELRKAEITMRNAALGLYGPEHIQAGRQALAEAGLAVPEVHTSNKAGSRHGRAAGHSADLESDAQAQAQLDGITAFKKKRQPDGANSMIIVLLALASSGSRVTIELKNDSVVVGTLQYVDKHMNCTLSDATESRQQPTEQRKAGKGKREMRMEEALAQASRPPLRLETMQLRGDSIRYVLPPRGFNARREVHVWAEKEQRKGRTPKLY
jgi:small nuclear ribonucleoprotein (snRNP)-like protein